MQDQLDYMAARVSLACVIGGAAGTTSALYRGALVGRTALLSSLSCGMAATACFSFERLASAVLASDEAPIVSKTTTHAIGGALGGALTGALYRKKPIQGALLLTPVLIVIGLGQELYDGLRQERLQQNR